MRAQASGKRKADGLFQRTRDFFQLYTKDLTKEDLKRVLWKDPQQVYRYFTAEMEREELQKLPLRKRLIKTIKYVFMAFTMKLSPARRVLYGLALIFFVIGYINSVIRDVYTFPDLLILSFLIFNLLLALELADKLVIKSDLDFAREIQLTLLTQGKIEVPGLDLYGVMVPANTVGGDYYDILKLSDSKVVIAIGDVSGKGAPAALLMAYLQASLRALVSEHLPIDELTRKLNVHLHKNTPSNSLITFFCGLIDLTDGAFVYSNAGHNPPLLIRKDGRMLRLCEGGIPLGILPEVSFQKGRVDLQAGDFLFLYTDGITEAANPSGQEFGDDRLEAIVKEKNHLGAEWLATEILRDVEGFVQDKKFADDLTIVIVSLQQT